MRSQSLRMTGGSTERPLIEDKGALDLVNRIACSLASDYGLYEDLMQEALLHLWRIERERPGQRLSWYMQSCRFRLQHYLASGRSLDSVKRRAAQVPLFEHDFDSNGLLEQLGEDCRELDQASARDLVASLACRLKPKERAVLSCLADGLTTSDIVKSLKLSAPTVTKYRRKIASYAAKLGLADGRRPAEMRSNSVASEPLQ